MKLTRICRFCLLVTLFMATQLHAQHNTSLGAFEDWQYTPTRIYGFTKLTDTTARVFYRVTQPDANTILVKEINAAGRLIKKTMVHFVNGKLSSADTYDEWGYQSKKMQFTPDTGQSFTVTETENGRNSLLPCRAMRYVFDNEKLAEIQYLSFENKLCNNATGVAIERYQYYDDSCRYLNSHQIAFFDEDGTPVYSKKFDCHKVIMDRDMRGNIVTQMMYNEDGHKLQDRYGRYKTAYTYDSASRIIQRIYYGLNDEVKSNIYNVAGLRYEYKNGFLISGTNCDVNGNPVNASDTGTGFATVRYQYDDNGNETSQSYYYANGEPANNASGIQKVNYLYNNRNLLVEKTIFDKTGAPTTGKENTQRFVYAYDDTGRCIQEAYFDAAGNPVKTRVMQICMIKYQYYNNGLVKEESYWKDKNTKMTRWDGVHRRTYTYNQQGQETEGTYYDTNDKLYVSEAGYSRTVTKYNAGGRTDEISRFDGNKPTVTKNSTIKNYHSIRYTYDNKNRVVQAEYLNEQEQPTNANIQLTDSFYCYRIEFKYIATTLTEENFYPLNSSFPSKTINCLKDSYVSKNGVLTMRKNPR